MATLFASWAWGFTLNRVSLFAAALLFGILVSTLLTLVVIPVLYYAANWRRFPPAPGD
ncbi:MAG: hypothetical protein HY527_18355 [Betaproteobacteria bacterium]|nr:hypothetical protein [Betaproteobacteria bacterium]